LPQIHAKWLRQYPVNSQFAGIAKLRNAGSHVVVAGVGLVAMT